MSKALSAKRVDIVNIQLVKESSMLYSNRRIRTPNDLAELFRDFIGSRDREYFVVACLNTKNEPTNISIAHMGSLNATVVHPREVFKTAVLSNAASICVCHVHPSGDPTPSQEDIDMTNRLKESGNILGIELLDHSARCS